MMSANRGDSAAYRRVLEALTPLLRHIVRQGLRRAGRGPEEAEDVVQETLLAVHLKRHTWDESQPLEPWVRAIARHKLVDALRGKGTSGYVSIDDAVDHADLSIEPVALDAIESADLLKHLSARDRTIVEAISVEGHGAREVGLRLGMTEGAVRVALHRALKAMAAAAKRMP
jgi:RNA polymerase sigma-70 factor (ECF subfamily)